MYKQGQVRLIKTHLPLSLLPPEMLNKCRWSKSLYFVCLSGLSGPVQGCLLVLWRRRISISHALLWLWILISITLSLPSVPGLCTLGGTQRTWQCPITTTTGSPSVAICYLSLQLVFAICFYNLFFVCKYFPTGALTPNSDFLTF